MSDYKKIFWISSYPRSGNTWIRLILCGLFFTKDGNLENLDILIKIPKFDSLNNFEFVKEISIDDYNLIFKENEYDEKTIITYSKYWIEAQKRIKSNEEKYTFFKTHNARIKLKDNYYTNALTTYGFIYLSRDPRDVVLSYSKHMNTDLNFTIDFLNNDHIMGNKKIDNRMPEIILNWKDHYRSWRKFIVVPSLFLKYEDLLDDIEREINKILNFFYENFNIDISNKNKKINNIIKSTNFDTLKNIEKNKGFFEKSEFSDFFRSGKKKQWENKLNQNQINLIEKFFRDQMIELKYL